MLILRTEKMPPTTTPGRVKATIFRVGLPLDSTIKEL
jgi:hypothetical protein